MSARSQLRTRVCMTCRCAKSRQYLFLARIDKTNCHYKNFDYDLVGVTGPICMPQGIVGGLRGTLRAGSAHPPCFLPGMLSLPRCVDMSSEKEKATPVNARAVGLLTGVCWWPQKSNCMNLGRVQSWSDRGNCRACPSKVVVGYWMLPGQ